jgi:hypothetical protein
MVVLVSDNGGTQEGGDPPSSKPPQPEAPATWMAFPSSRSGASSMAYTFTEQGGPTRKRA